MNASERGPRSAPPRREEDIRAGRRLMVGLLAVFFGMMFVANGLIVYFASTSTRQLEPSYEAERR